MRAEDVAVPDSDAWWLSYLMRKLAARAPRVTRLGKWMAGDPPLPFPDNMKPGFERLQDIAKVNLASLVVEARLHRMQLLGATTTVDDSANGDDEVAGIFRDQNLRAKLYEVLRYALGESVGYAFLRQDGTITVADGLHAIMARDAAGRPVAALNIWRDEINNRDVAILARPGYFRVATHQGTTLLPKESTVWVFGPESWEFEEAIPSGTEGIPVYEFTPPGGKSLIEPHLPTLQRINHGILQRMILIALQAFRQRALKGMPDRDPETGDPIENLEDVFESAPDALWTLPEGVDVWESGQADLGPVLTANKDDVRYLAVSSKTPLFMISPDDANGSAEGAATQREILIFDVESIIAGMESEIKRLISDALAQRGDTERADLSGIRLMWANPRRSSITERAQAAATAAGAGVPFRLVMEKFAELDPDVVEEAERLRSDDLFAQALSTPKADDGGQ
ncbi:hypothetical protein [Streptomyces niveus]|uniref:hypothetical protein n=2 Tax=Streptomyces TaxID=1883 RepID=UPI00342440DD